MEVDPVRERRGTDAETMSSTLVLSSHAPRYQIEFLKSLGCDDPITVVAERPSLLSLDATSSLPRIVDYLRRSDYDEDQILEMICKSI